MVKVTLANNISNCSFGGKLTVVTFSIFSQFEAVNFFQLKEIELICPQETKNKITCIDQILKAKFIVDFYNFN